MDLQDKGMRFSPSKTKSKVTCSTLQCKSSASKDPTLRFHCLPKAGEVEIVNKLNIIEKVNRKQVWIRRLKISENCRFPKICSLHFTQNDYLLDDTYKNKILKKNAVPSVNLPTDNMPNDLKKKTNKIMRAKRIENRASKRKLALETIQNKNIKACLIKSNTVKENNTDMEINTANNTAHYIDTSVKNSYTTVFFQKNIVNLTTTFQDKCVQVEFERFRDFIQSEKDLNAMTGLGSFNLLYSLEDIVKITVPNIQLNLCQSLTQLSIKDRIVLTFIKLKQNVSYKILSALFKVFCEGTCRKIFLRMVEILAAGLQSAIHWPSKEKVLNNIPKCFDNFRKIRAVVDGIEISIQKPKKACCQSDMYSLYKSTYTIKFMTAVSPGGIITFVSNAYPGKSSDKAIFEQSKFIEKLDENDALMVDKGFLIDDICLKHGIQLISVPLLRNKKQFSKEEALFNTQIAKTRVYIKRLNQRLKVFKILNTRIPSYLVSRIEQIFHVICAIVNLDAPILKDDDQFIVE